jgi:photosynthetic reaction center H subunit
MSPVFTGHIDVTLVVFDAFVLFFIGLVIYLNRESRREGFPLEDDVTGQLQSKALFLDASPKLFRLPFGRGTRSTADYPREPVKLAAQRENFGGAPYRPTGNPLVDGIGPAAYANRANLPDLDFEGHPRIVPLSTTDAVWIDKRDPDPRGMKVTAADGAVAGTVTDVWVDKADRLIRYLTVDTGTRSVLAPMAMATVRRTGISIDAITAAQFADAPAIANATTITLYEEERVSAYFGGGYLYATPDRQEPLL